MLKQASIAATFFVLAACSSPGPDVSAHGGWARETGTSRMTAAYLTIENDGSADQLTGVRSSIGQASLHESVMEGGVMRMRPIDPAEGLTVPSNGKLVLAPGGAHVMIAQLPRPLKAGDRFSLTLQFAKSRQKKISVTVASATQGALAH